MVMFFFCALSIEEEPYVQLMWCDKKKICEKIQNIEDDYHALKIFICFCPGREKKFSSKFNRLKN